MNSENHKLLNEAYELTDKVIYNQILNMKNKPVCKSGCSVCCEDMDLFVLKIELENIRNFIINTSDDESRKIIHKNISELDKSKSKCPFLIKNNCGIYKVRPLVCRGYYVKNKVCTHDENVLTDRFKDLVNFDKEKLGYALRNMYSVFGFDSEEKFMKEVKDGYIFKNSVGLYEQNLQQEIFGK